ncbi:MAG: hypothetical protein ABL974_20750 [Prosthecobacter sp.]
MNPKILLFTCLLITTLGSALPMRPEEQKLPEVETIPLLPGAFFEKDYLAQERTWAQRCLLKPAQKGWEGKPWAAEATALVEAALELKMNEGVLDDTLGPLAPRFRELLKAVSDDPLLNVLAAQSLYAERKNWRDSKAALDQALNQGNLSAALECQALTALLTQRKSQNESAQAVPRARLLEAMIRAVSDGSYDAESEAVFVRHQIALIGVLDAETIDPIVRWQAVIAESAWPEWVKLTLQGEGEVDLAWVERTSLWASEVTKEQWEGFAAHLKVARDLLAKANRLKPDRPESASVMIKVARGEGVDEAEIRSWFDRAVSAQFDYQPAYRNLLWAYLPRWGGSHGLMLAFGRACAETKRFDTIVPSRLMTASLSVAEEVGEPRQVFRHESVQKAIVTMSQGYLDAKDTPPQTRHLRVSNAAFCAWMADDDALAVKALKEAGPRLHAVTRQYLHSILLHENLMRAEASADAGEYGEAIRAAANPPKNTDIKTMIEILKKVDEKDLSPAALAYLQEGRDLVSFTEALASGEWVPLQMHQHMTNYYQDGGEWSVDKDGTLVATGDDTQWAKLALRIPLKEDIELQGEYSIDVPEGLEMNGSRYAFGPMLRWQKADETCVRFMVFHNEGHGDCTQAYCTSLTNAAPDRSITIQPTNKFSVRVADGKMSYDLNGKVINSAYSLKKLGLENDIGYLGFASFQLPWGGKVRVSGLKVRKITAKELVTAKPTSAAIASPITTAAITPKSNKLYWQLGLIAALLVIFGFVQKFVKPSEG